MSNALAVLLNETVDEAKDRERTAFDNIAGDAANRLVLFGAGGLGQRTLRALREQGIEPLAFADSNAKRWGATQDGIPILSPKDAADRYGDSATFVVTIWGGLGIDRMNDRIAHLRELGCARVTSFVPLYWKYPDSLIPHYGADFAHKTLQQRDEVIAAYELFIEEASRREYEAQIRWRLHADFEALPAPVSHPIYFPKDLCDLRDDEVFVDCGAFDGDTVDLFIRESDGQFESLIAFEPDPSNFKLLAERVASYPEAIRNRIALKQAATGSTPGMVSMAADGLPSSAVGSGDHLVHSIVLDEALENATYLKMDIEGSEIDTLKGAAGIIRKCRPALAVCVYHKQDDLWKIPLLIHGIQPGYSFFLRPHLNEMWDLVCYAIPNERLKSRMDN